MSQPTTDDAHSLKVVLVTGATDGIGKATAAGIARTGAHVVVHGRNRPRVDATVAELRAAHPDGQFDGVSFDLASLDAVRSGATLLLEKLPRLDVLVNNAGIFCNERLTTGAGLEMTLAVNHLGPFLLTALLSPALRAARGRVVNVSSIAHTRGRIHQDDLQLERSWTGYAAYAQSKLANVMHAIALAETDVEITAYSLHPGVIQTKLLRDGFAGTRGAPVDDGAALSIQLATTDVEAPSGSYFSGGVATPPGTAARDAAVRAWLVAESRRLVGLGS